MEEQENQISDTAWIMLATMKDDLGFQEWDIFIEHICAVLGEHWENQLRFGCAGRVSAGHRIH